MDSKPSPAQADPHRQGDVVSLAPKDWTDAEEALSKLAHVTSDRIVPDRRRPAAGSEIFAGPRMTVQSPDTRLPGAGANSASLSTDPPSRGKRRSRGLARFLLAASVGVAATLAWQSYGAVARQMIASSAPQLGWLLASLPVTNPPSAPEIAVEQPSPPVASPQAASAQAVAAPATTSETAASTVPADSSVDSRQLETMSRDLAVVRESVQQLAASQEQIARDIAKLQTEGQDIRRRVSALPPVITTRKPVPPPQSAAQSSVPPPPSAQPAAQAAAAPLPTTPPQPAPQPGVSAAAPPTEPALRPPMPVR